MRSNAKFHAVLALVALFALPLATACGKKEWPEPRDMGWRFHFEAVTGQAQAGCLSAAAHVEGAWKNLDHIILELAETTSKASCPTCPFHPSQRVELTSARGDYTLEDGRLTLNYCQLDPAKSYAWRLVGFNAHPEVRVVTSPVLIATP